MEKKLNRYLLPQKKYIKIGGYQKQWHTTKNYL